MWIFPILGAILMTLATGTIGTALALNFVDADTRIGFVVMLLVSFGAVAVGVAGWMRIRKQSGWARWFPRREWGNIYIGLAFGLVLFGIALSIANLLIDVQAQWIGALPIFALFGWLVQGSVEEIVTRGWLFDRLKPWGEDLQVWGTAVAFTAMHAMNPNVNYLALLNIFLFGILMALIVRNKGNLWHVAGIHSGWNFAQANFFTMPVSGVSVTSASVFAVTASGPRWLSGGEFGLESSIITTVLLSIIIVREVIK